MSTLIRNVGILDARKATAEKLAEIGKLTNIGVLVVNPEIKEQLMKISMLNIGSTLELTDDYRFHIGPKIINRQLLEDSDTALKMVIVGQITIDQDTPAELLQAKLEGLYIVGQVAVPEHLYGVFMSRVKELTGMVDVIPVMGKAVMGKVNINDNYLKGLEDNTELSVVGKIIMAEQVDPDLFSVKIASLSLVGGISCLDSQEAMLRKVLKESSQVKFRISRADCHYLPEGSKLDTFSLMSVQKSLVCSTGILVIDEQINPDLFQNKKLQFEASVVYFPMALMNAMLSRLEGSTKGVPYEPGKLEVTGGHQQITNARLEAMADKSTLVVCGILDIDPQVPVESLIAKIGVVDNYGKIVATRDAASILQAKLRQNEGAITPHSEEDEDEDATGYDHVIENVANYVL